MHTSMNRWMHLAIFLANLARVIGPGGLRKSLVGICLLHGRYPGHCNDQHYGCLNAKVETYLKTDRNTRSTPPEDRTVSVLQAVHSRMKSIGQRDTTLFWVWHPAVDWSIKSDLFYITLPVTVGVRHIHLLRDERPHGACGGEGQCLLEE